MGKKEIDMLNENELAKELRESVAKVVDNQRQLEARLEQQQATQKLNARYQLGIAGALLIWLGYTSFWAVPGEVGDQLHEQIPSEVAQQVAEVVPPAVAQQVAERVPSEVAEHVAASVPPAVAQQVAEVVPPAVAQQVAERIPSEVAEHVAASVPPAVAQQVAEVVPPAVAQQVAESIPREVAERVAESVPPAVAQQIAEVVPPAVAKQVAEVVPPEVQSRAEAIEATWEQVEAVRGRLATSEPWLGDIEAMFSRLAAGTQSIGSHNDGGPPKLIRVNFANAMPEIPRVVCSVRNGQNFPDLFSLRIKSVTRSSFEVLVGKPNNAGWGMTPELDWVAYCPR